MLIFNTPKKFASADVTDFKEKYEFSFDSRESLFITGACGTGKTHLSIALGNMAIKNKNEDVPIKQSKFVNYPDFIVDVKCSFNDSSSSSMRKLISDVLYGFIIFDDICTSKSPTAVDIDTLYLIVNERYQENIPTIYTSNLSLKEIATAYNDRISSRLSACKIIELTGKDRRLK
jgi:DNA replication protein DnaC